MRLYSAADCGLTADGVEPRRRGVRGDYAEKRFNGKTTRGAFRRSPRDFLRVISANSANSASPRFEGMCLSLVVAFALDVTVMSTAGAQATPSRPDQRIRDTTRAGDTTRADST